MENESYQVKNTFSLETLIFVLVFGGIVTVIGNEMGMTNFVNTLMNTAAALLTDTVWYIMAIAVLAGGLSGLLTEFGVVAVINRLLSPLVKPLYGMPGASIVGIITTFLSDNPAILALANDNNFVRYFKKYQIPALANIGTSFGMGLIVVTFMLGLQPTDGTNFYTAVLAGVLGAVVGSIISTRLMLIQTAKRFGKDAEALESERDLGKVELDKRLIRNGSAGTRFMDALLEGGKSGVKMGLGIIPGVLIICSIVMILTNGPSDAGTYTGAAYEGVAFLPWLAGQIDFLLQPLFGFSYAGAIAVPITALGSAGASLGMIPDMVAKNLVGGNEIAVFTAMCMCWSGYLSTHIAMMDELKCNQLVSVAILSHTIGGLSAGIAAHFFFILL